MRCARNGFREFCSRRAAPHTPSRNSVTLSDPLPPILRLIFLRFPPLAAGKARPPGLAEPQEQERGAAPAATAAQHLRHSALPARALGVGGRSGHRVAQEERGAQLATCHRAGSFTVKPVALIEAYRGLDRVSIDFLSSSSPKPSSNRPGSRAPESMEGVGLEDR